MTISIESTVRKFIEDNFLFGQAAESLGENDSLLAGGVVDSAGVLSLVIFLEETFAIQVLDDEVVPDNLDSISKLTTYIRQKTSSKNGSVQAS